MSPSAAACTGLAVWTGTEMMARTDWRFELTPDHRAEALRALAALGECDLREITRDRFALPTLGPVLDEMVEEVLDGRGFVLLRGLPLDGLDEANLQRLFWGVGAHIGVGIPQNDAGEVLVHVRDQGLDFSDPTVRGYQTTAKLEFHSDSSDVVALLCVRPAREGGASTVVSSAAVFNEAVAQRPDLARELLAPWWWDRRRSDLSTSFFRRPIFAFDQVGRSFSYYGRAHIESAQRGEHVPALTAREVEALDLLDAVAAQPGVALDMQFLPGDVQLLNNYRIWHARTEYVDFPEPERRRDLLRLWLTVRQELGLPEAFAAGGITDRSAGVLAR